MGSNEEKLESFQEGFPATFSSFFKDACGQTKKVSSFLTNSPPDITPNTRILAVCGVSDYPENAASPEDDGWFYSDFFTFHTLLYGQGAAQKWCCSDDPSLLLQKYGKYLHRNPDTERRVVLSKSLIQIELQDVRVFSAPDLLQNVLELLREEATLAVQQNTPLILFLFGHGAETTKSVEIGVANNELSVSTVHSVVGDEVDLTVISTACYSGGWVVTSLLNATVLSAAGPGDESESWPKSHSLSRACGSIYASTLAKSLADTSSHELQHPQPESPSPPSSGQDTPTTLNDQQSMTFSEFARTIHTLLLTGVDRLGYHHSISFSARDDDWESHWRKRTGFPLADLKAKWESLELVQPQVSSSSSSSSSSSPSSPLNRDPCTDLDIQTDNISLYKLRGRYGSISSYTGQLRRLAISYLASYPGRDSLAPNSSFHQKCRDLISKQKKFNLSTLETIESTLRYRMSLSFLANQLVSGSGLPLPQGKLCEEWDPIKKGEYEYEERNAINERLYPLFPPPLPGQGRGWNKPRWYIVAALMEANFSPTELSLKIENLLLASQILERGQEVVLQSNPVVQSKRRRLLRSC
ncbi:hypothetical protein MGYG_01189 [Nannizzia gypsea CBS 118893]|uniref:Uncharacterized protein n=1 Tax=Arthroderma gypseum (strain ATCC MYA-4604 / CBS 118893) TaxID=535722 RepID=E5QZD5_ARTGP|nr:hypothetical protein MGYG_01189 [Nannizzia gypsea CBS 118893]EFQ98153.1 hypothetical protein MGYG_01189 [Nannizzia gypsea CBS 118893]